MPRPQPTDTHDATLHASLLRGDGGAFLIFYAKHQRALLGLAGAILGSPQSAEEVTQECWAAFSVGLDRFEGRSSLRTWLFSILVNLARARAKREQRSVPFSALDSPDADIPSLSPNLFDDRGVWRRMPRPWTASTPEALVGQSQVLGLLEDAMSALPPRQRAVLLLRDVEQLPSEEVAALLGLTEGNQRVLLHRARTTLRMSLSPHLEVP